MSKVYFTKSKIEANGVFAGQNLSQGEEILRIDDSYIVEESKLTQHQKDYEADWLTGDKVILMQSPERYINHSCNPNSHVETKDNIRYVIALQNIRQGDDITYDYGEDFTRRHKCSCGSPNCRNPK